MKIIYGPFLALAAALCSAPALAQSVERLALAVDPDSGRDVSDPIIVATVDVAPAAFGSPFAAHPPATMRNACTVLADLPCSAALVEEPESPTLLPVSIGDNAIEDDESHDLAHWDLAAVRPDAGVFSGAPRPDPATAEAEGRYRLSDTTCGLACKPAGAGIDPYWADHVKSDYGFWRRVGAVKTESLVFLGYFGIMSGNKLFKDTKPFHFKNEGWFGKDTDNIGVDKLTHAFNTYLLAEFLHNRMHRRTGAADGDAVTAAIIASSLMIFNEFSDGIEVDSGWSIQDVLMNLGGAGFSVLRNTVPGLKEKVAFKIEVIPNGQIYSHVGKKHYAQQRFMFSLKGSGFHELDNSPLRYLDLQLGYYASDFLLSDRAAGIEPKRHLFVGVGLNLGELLLGKSTSKVGKAAYSFLDYFQVPYTSLRYDTTGRLGN